MIAISVDHGHVGDLHCLHCLKMSLFELKMRVNNSCTPLDPAIMKKDSGK